METLFTLTELEQKLGAAIKRLRLQKNMTRQILCSQAGISLTALRNLENGQGANLRTLISALRSLGRQDWLLSIAPQITINPLDMLRDKPIRQRASRSRKVL